MGKSKTKRRIPDRKPNEPASPIELATWATSVMGVACLMSADEFDRVMAAASAMSGDSDALERIAQREQRDEIGSILRDPDCTSVEVEGDARGNITRTVRRRG